MLQKPDKLWPDGPLGSAAGFTPLPYYKSYNGQSTLVIADTFWDAVLCPE